MLTCASVAQLGLDLAKATFDNVAASVDTLQTIVEDQLTAAVRGTAWIPGPVGDVLGSSVGLARCTRGSVRAVVDRCYVELSRLVGNG